MKKIYFVLLMLGLILTSCGGGGNPQGRANDLCDCFKDAGVDFDGIKNPDDLDKIGDKMSEKKGQKCVLAVLEGIEEDISDLDDKETGEYFRKFIKGMLDTECVSEVMEDILPVYIPAFIRIGVGPKLMNDSTQAAHKRKIW